MSKHSRIDNSFILKNVKAVDQNKFESDILSKADKAYKNHVKDEQCNIQKKLSEISDRIKILSKSVKELNDCLIYNLNKNNCSHEEFEKIKNSLQNQISLKQAELTKLNKLERKYKDQLTSFEISEEFNKILDEAGKVNNLEKNLSLKKHKRPIPTAPAKSKNIVLDDNSNDSDGSISSTKTMVFEPSEELLEYVEPFIKKRKIVFATDETNKKRIPKIKCGDKIHDDGNYGEFCERIEDYKNRVAASDSTEQSACPDDFEELENGFQVPMEIWHKLYGYQQTGVQWLLQLHTNGVGGILGDEMGLGKTIQIISFLAGLARSSAASPNHYEIGPILIVCPATVMHQWMDEFRTWAPLFRVALLHATGSGYDKPEYLLKSIATHPGVLVTTYSSMVIHHALLIQYPWQYVILDEGHKIKNPNAKVTTCIKQFQTSHRLILSGSPIQNNLKELWSLVDFVYPGKLGSMATFIQNFAVPIMKGGYEHASPLQVETAYRCACVIRDTINEYLLRRTKAEVELQLPRKKEQVLFCGLTEHQQVVYKEYLASRQCRQILSGQQVPFPGLVMLRKICNHPDLVTGGPKCVLDHPVLGFSREDTADGHGHKFGHYSQSGKMIVVKELLQLWFQGKHKVLLFTQGRLMLQVLKRFIEQQGYPMCTMDGSTAIGSRHAIVNRFNDAPYDEIFIFLLTTRVGGLGLNLVGADRVLVFDPDWNPCTDLQARERAWRIGQNRKVVIYRLVISGSVEEKIYHRQVFKQFLTNRILKNPRQRRFFKTQDLRDLFRLDEPGAPSDTSLMFRGSKHHRKLQSNYFDEEPRLPINATLNEDEDDGELQTSVDLTALDMNCNEDEAIQELMTASQLSEMELVDLRRRARELSRALSRLQQPPCAAPQTQIEGKLITNVCASKEFKAPQEESTDQSKSSADTLVAALVPRKSRDKSNVSYSDICAAERVAEKAKRSLDQTLTNAGVTERLSHDSFIEDITPDWVLVQRETDAAARSGAAWLRGYLVPHDKLGVSPIFGVVTNSFLWNKNEEKIYFEGMETSSKSHFSGHSQQIHSKSSQRNVRFSSPFILAIIRNRNPADQGQHVNTVASSHVKGLTKNIYLFLSTSSECHATSNDLINHFRDQVSAKNNLLFKSILNELCTFQRSSSNGASVWCLRPEFINR